MRILEGQNVDLISPFPAGEIKRMYGWTHCYRTVCESDFSPKTQEDFIAYMQGFLPQCASWGIIDKNHITNIKHEAPLVGVFIYEPASFNTGYLHVATARKCWRTGLVDEACDLVVKDLFDGIPTLTRIGASMVEKNSPAKALAKRHGFQFEGLFRDVITQNGEPTNMVYFGLTRRDWLWQHSSQQQSASEAPSSEELVEVENKEE